MKTTIFICFIILLGYSSFAQEEIFLLIPEPGMEYSYEITERSYIQNENFRKLDELVRKKVVNIKCSEFENNRTLAVNIIKNSVEKPDSIITKFKDYRYPEFKDGFYSKRYHDFYEGLLCRIEFKYDFNIETSAIKLENREQVLLEVRGILKQKGFGKDEIDKRTLQFNKEEIPKVTGMLQSIYHVKQNITGTFHPKETEYESTFTIKDDIIKITNKSWNLEPGVYLGNYSINQKDKYLVDWHTIKIDSLRYPRKTKYGAMPFKASEYQTCLKRRDRISLNRFVLSGKIENTEAKTVRVSVLKRTYGTNRYIETFPLDEENSFKVDIELSHPSFVNIQFGKSANFGKNVLSFYAEPGGEIHFEATGEKYPWNLQITGDNPGPSKLLNDLASKHVVFEARIMGNTIKNIGYRMKYDHLLAIYNGFDDFIKGYKDQMDEESFRIVTNELKAGLLCSFHSYLSIKRYALQTTSSFPNGYPYLDEIYISELEAILDSYDIDKIYNEYGYLSRTLAQQYLNYQFQKIKKVYEVGFSNYRVAGVNIEFYYGSDISQRVEIARAVLTGHPLYAQLMDIFVSELRKENQRMVQDKDYTFKVIDEYLDLITRVVNDEKFIDEITEQRNKYLYWQSDSYVPEVKFFDLTGEEKYFKDYLGEKPTVFYVSSQWATERYYWDKLAEENPELNVVMVMEGSNFEEWTSYMERATPVAEQLLLMNHIDKLAGVFLRDYRHYLAYNKDGKLIGIMNSANDVIKLAKDSLRPKKKELNKSQLKYIIIILVTILTALLIVLLIWKWRVRQRFRKEASNRKLRELELTAIRSQMNPHFLFNSLNSVQNLVQQNKGREAHLYLSDFAGLIRKVLNNSEKEEVSLAEELEMIGQYLNLEKLRFDFEFEVIVGDEIDRHNTLVPSMLLQPFVENAVIHGLQSKQGNKQLIIEVSKSDSGIKICIEDNGIGRDAAKQIAKTKNGKGTKLMQERLEILQEKQGEKYSLEIVDLEEGTRVEILIPEEK